MSCNCQVTTCINLRSNPCLAYCELDIIATESGIWSASIEFSGAWIDFTFEVAAGKKIVIPNTIINEQYKHTLAIYDSSGNLFNNTCYYVGIIHFTTSVYPTPPYINAGFPFNFNFILT